MIQRTFSQLPAVYHAVHRATWLHVLVILAAGAALRWPLLALAPFFTSDGRYHYHYAVHQLLAGLPFDSYLHRPPGYSLFLTAILAVTEGSTAAAILVQHLLGLAAGVLVYLIGRRLFGPLIGLAAALLTVLDVELALYEHAVMTETLFTSLLLCALALVLLRWPGSIWLKVAGFGLLVGTATLVRPVGLSLPGLALLLPGLGPASGAASVALRSHAWYRQLWYASRRVRLTAVAVIGAALIVVPMMVWNKQTHGVFALTTSLQRNMLYPIEAAPGRLLQGRGGGDPLLGQIKATLSYHHTSPWVAPYNRLQERFHLSNAALDRLLVRVGLDFVLADPLAHIGDTMRRLSQLLTAGGASAVGHVQRGHRQYTIAGDADRLGVREYHYAAELEAAQAFDQRMVFLHYGRYTWMLLGLAIFAGTRYYGRAALLVAVILALTIVPAANLNIIAVRFRYPVTWAIYLLAAAGAAGVFSTLWIALTSRAGRWRGLWLTSPLWPTIRRGQLPLLVALLTTAVVLATLAAGRSAFDYRPHVVPPAPTLGISSHLLSERLDHIDWQVPVAQPTSRLVALSLPDQLSFDLVGPDGLVPDGRADVPLLLTVGHEVPGQVLKFVDLGDASGPTWDTTGWYQPLLIIRVDDGEYLSQHTDPRSEALRLRLGDRLLVLAAAQGQPVTPEQFGVLRLHLGDGSVLSYPVEAEPFAIPWPDTALAPQDWLAQHAAASARVAMVQREEVRVVTAGSAFSTTPWRIALTSGDRAAIRKWLHAETLDRHAIQYLWVGNSAALKGEAATAVLDPTRLRPVLLQVEPGACPVSWRGLFVVATAAAATNVSPVPLTIPHPLADDEFQGALRFSEAGVGEPLTSGAATMVQLAVTNQSIQRWYGTCGSHAYPVGVAVEGRRLPAASWTLVGETLLRDDLPAGETHQVAVGITVPREAGRYELRARLVQRPDRVSPTAPASANLVVAAASGG